MAGGSDSRVGERQPTSMRIRLKYPDIDTFIQKYAVNISRGGIFIATKQPKPVGTQLRFEFLLANGDPGESIIRGEGQVQWTREYDPSQPTKAHGMGVRFTRLDPDSQEVIDRALSFRATTPANSPPRPQHIPSQPSGPISMDTGPKRLDTGRVDKVPGPLTGPSAPPSYGGAPAIDSGPLAPLPDVKTEPDALAAGGASEMRGRDGPTKEVSIPDEPLRPMGRPPNIETKPIRVDDPRITALDEQHERGANGAADLDSLAAEWGVSRERIQRALKRKRPRMVEATKELEELLTKPPRAPTPTKEEALAALKDLLKKDR
jgi:uncharacterized protein (TIGR02266 family)